MATTARAEVRSFFQVSCVDGGVQVLGPTSAAFPNNNNMELHWKRAAGTGHSVRVQSLHKPQSWPLMKTLSDKHWQCWFPFAEVPGFVLLKGGEELGISRLQGEI